MVRSREALAIAAALALASASISIPAAAQNGSRRWSIGAGVESLGRTIEWDGAASASKLKLLAATLKIEYRIEEGLLVTAIGGYASSSLDGVVFRTLPFSLEWSGGGLPGVLLGAGMKKNLLSPGRFEMGAEVRYVVFWGMDVERAIMGLSERGTARAGPRWMAASVGPFIGTEAWAPFAPYLIVYYSSLWGRFRMEEMIAGIGGSEIKTVTSRGRLGATAGLRIGPLSKWSFVAEVDLLPCRSSLDLGARLNVIAAL